MKQDNQKYCSECGELINVKAEICPKCGVRQISISVTTSETAASKDNKWLACLLLCWFLGFLGVHRFYTGHIGIGVFQALTLGGCGIWMLIDLITIVSGNFKDAQGNQIKNA